MALEEIFFTSLSNSSTLLVMNGGTKKEIKANVEPASQERSHADASVKLPLQVD